MDMCEDIVILADDTTLLAKSKNLEELMREAEEAFGEAGRWFQSNKLQLNGDETQKLLCSLNHAESPEKGNVKLLGLILDSKLTSDSHVAEVFKRLARVLSLLMRLRKLMIQPYLLTTYKYYALFHILICYGLLH